MHAAPYDLSAPPQDDLQAALQPGERVGWSGRPNPRRMVLAGIVSTMFFIPWRAFAVFCIFAASGFQMPTLDGPPGLFPLFGLPFVLVGVFGLSAPLRSFRRAQRTIHAITDDRALTVVGGLAISVTSWTAEHLGRSGASRGRTARATSSSVQHAPEHRLRRADIGDALESDAPHQPGAKTLKASRARCRSRITQLTRITRGSRAGP